MSGKMLSIAFGRTLPVYYPRELLEGDIVVNTPLPTKILDLTVNYVGYSSVSFLAASKVGKITISEKVEETDTHLDILHPLIKSYRGLDISAGIQTYTFSLNLPSLLPSSYKSPYGDISYYIHVRLQTSTATLELRKPFFILASVNINLFSSSQRAESEEVIKWYGLMSQKPLRMKASVTKTCFVPGDTIPVFVEISNETTRRLRYLFCTLKQKTVALVQLEDRSEERVSQQCLVTVAHKLIDGCGHYSWICQLPSPTFLTPTIAASTILFVTYYIQVSAKLNQVQIAPEVQIPVVFGTRNPVCIEETVEKSIRSSKINCHLKPQIHTSMKSEMNPEISTYRNYEDESLPSVTKPRRRVAVCTVPKPSLLQVKPEPNQNSDNLTLEEGSLSSDFSPDQNVPKRRITVCCYPEFTVGGRYNEFANQSNLENRPARNYSSNLKSETSGNSVKRRITVCGQPSMPTMFDFIRQESMEDEPSDTPILNSSRTRMANLPYRKAPVYTQPEFGYATIIKYESRQEQIKNREKILEQGDFLPRVDVMADNTNRQLEDHQLSRVTTATRRVGIQLHSVASNITRRLSSQWQSRSLFEFRRFSCDLQKYLIK